MSRTTNDREVVDPGLDVGRVGAAHVGVGQVQITRRLVVLPGDLIPDVPEDLRALLRRHRESLETAVARRQLAGGRSTWPPRQAGLGRSG